MQLLAKFKKSLYIGFRATLNYLKFKKKIATSDQHVLKVAQNSFQHFPRRSV